MVWLPHLRFVSKEILLNRGKCGKKSLDFYLCATEADSKPDKVKTSILLTCIGEKGRAIYETFEFENAGDKLKFKPVLKKFEEYCNPRSNTTIQRHKFFTYRQTDGQSFTDFVTELKKLSSECAFDVLKDSLIKDMIICGVIDNGLRERMLREPQIDLKKAVELGQAAEQTKLHAKQIANDMEKRVENVNKYEKKRVNSSRPQASRDSGQLFRNCKFCAGSHQRGNCPAYGQKCNKCHRKNHFARCCRQKVDNIRDDQNNSPESSDDSDFCLESVIVSDSDVLPDYQEALKVDTVSSDIATGHWSVTLNSGSQDILFKIDTGAQVNVLPKHIYNKLVPRPKIKTTSTKLSAYNGSTIPVHGKCLIPLTHKGQQHHLLFIIVNSETTPIIGLDTSERLNLIKRVYKVTESSIEESFSSNTIPDDYPECFGEIGTLKSTYHMEIKDDVSPVVVPPRKIPFALKDRLKKELDHMETMGIIEKVEKSTDWVNALVVVEKPNGKLRICLDPRPLNQAIKRQHYRLPTTEEIISEMAGAKVFSKLDASNGYWQIAVDDPTSDLLTFGTTFGRYKFKRMPYGIHSASEIFQLEISKIIAGCEGSINSQDDIIVWGENKEIHDQRLHKVLAKIKESGLKLNQSICLFGVSELTFLGHVMSAEGVKPDPKKIEAITAMPVPTMTKVELQRFLGMVNYLGKFIPNLSDETTPLRALLKNETEFLMQKPQLDAFEKLKRLISSVPVLQFFDPNLPTRIRTDSSSVGLGAMLEQCVKGSWHPIAFASRALDKSEHSTYVFLRDYYKSVLLSKKVIFQVLFLKK